MSSEASHAGEPVAFISENGDRAQAMLP